MVGNTNDSRQNDTGDGQRREGPLRAHDILPPYNKQVPRKSISKDADQSKDIFSAGPQANDSEIPTFDLAEKIMAEQRKNTAAKRRAPGIAANPPGRQAAHITTTRAVKLSAISSSEHKVIIAEIVARDIQKLRRTPFSRVTS